MRRERVASVAVALLLVLSAMTGALGPASVVETAQASFGFQNCDVSDSLITAVIDSFTDPRNGDKCRFNPDDGGLDGSLDRYQTVETLNSTTTSYIVAQENYGNATRSTLWTEAKYEIVNGLNAGNTSAVVKTEANETIRNQTSVRQRNMIESWNARVYALESVWLRNQTTLDANEFQYNITGFASHNITLANGTTVDARMPVAYDDTNNDMEAINPFANVRYTDSMSYNFFNKSAGFFESETPIDQHRLYKMKYTGPTQDTGSIYNVLSVERYHVIYEDSWGISKSLTKEVDVYVDGVYAEYKAGEISLDETLSPVELASRASGSYNDSGYYGYASAELASLGYSSNLTASYSVTVNGTERFNGTLFYTADDLAQVQNGTTYDLSNLNGTFFMSVQGPNGTGEIRTFGHGNVTVTAITNPETGDGLQNVTFSTYTQSSYDASELKQEIDRLEELREFYESQDTGGGGGEWSPNASTQAAVGVVLVLLGVLLAIRARGRR